MRRADWVKRLRETVETWKDAPFEYGRHDCCLFTARCIDAMTDGDYAEALSKCYSDERTARRFILSHGGIDRAVSAFLGEPVAGYCARRGDACLVPVEGGLGVGVCVGTSIAVASDVGFVHYPLSAATKHWTVD